ncbi:hypothetical protein F5X68DRAFT_247804 [Plectosphaerella plurivora]|uniref:Peptidyl-prolyl cis-trans isomerase n=1 Tax=Plectosphaerella plurivora TaxID=936078 RepID=A0A9P8VKG6_9PEZI|nr:hypothetical protein F5X68DRAFT_247804 [Plectosphaerella plurivora]
MVSPIRAFITAGSDTGLPPNWEVRHSNSKNLPYYFNTVEKVSRWEPPSGADVEKLKNYMSAHHAQSSLHPPPGAGAVPEGKIRAAHILVKHAGSRRPSSWREPTITRSIADARVRIEEFEGQIRRGDKTFAEIASKESDCSSFSKSGDLGYFGKGDMQKEFESAAFATEVGQMSGVIETASGLHLIQRLE